MLTWKEGGCTGGYASLRTNGGDNKTFATMTST